MVGQYCFTDKVLLTMAIELNAIAQPGPVGPT